LLLRLVAAQVEGGDGCGEQQHRGQFDHQQVRAEQADAHGFGIDGGTADGLAAL
jgi:hypothetical protein